MQAVPFILILLFSIIIHEISHGMMALWNGDRTAKEAGRLTLNPVSHIDIFGSILLPAILYFAKTGILFGWAKPVPINPLNFHNRKRGIFLVGMAGPAANVFLALLFSALFHQIVQAPILRQYLLFGIMINLGLAVFNLIPIPPLDGSRALGVLLPRELRKYYFSLERVGLLIILLLFYTGIIQKIFVPVYLKALSLFI